MSLKSSWIPKLLGKGIQSSMVYMFLIPLGLHLELFFKMSFRNRESFSVIKKLPDFYQEIIITFNKIKTIRPITALNDAEVFSQCIWENEYFELNNRNLL